MGGGSWTYSVDGRGGSSSTPRGGGVTLKGGGGLVDGSVEVE